MGVTHLLDSNVTIGLATKQFSKKEHENLIDLIATGRASYSLISCINIFAKANLNFEEHIAIESICNPLERINISIEIADIATHYRKTTKVKISDCIVDASAYAAKLILITNDKKDFSKLDGLNWMPSNTFFFKP